MPSILGFKETRDPSHSGFMHVGYTKNVENGNPNALNRHLACFPVDVTYGSQLIIVYIDFTEYQHDGDSRAPVIRIMESERRLRNGILKTVTPVHHKTFTNLDYKRLISNNIESIKVEPRNETGKLVPFTGAVSLKFQRTS